MDRVKKLRVAAVMLLAAALLLLVFGGSSPLYPRNPWVDANCFHTIAREMARGKVLYRDIIEQKGPLLYLLHIPSVLISPNGFFGVYLLEVLALAAFMFISWRTVSLFVKEKFWPLLIFAGFAIVTSRAFVWGDSAEEICAPVFAWAIYDAMKYLAAPDGKMKNICLLKHGILAGCIVWIKFSLLGLYFAWMAVIALECVFRKRKIGRALVMCLIFVGGMVLAAVPWIIYYAANGALQDMVNVYFIQNTVQYDQGFNPTVAKIIGQRETNPVITALIGIFGGSAVNPLMGLMIAGGLGCVLFAKREGKFFWQKLALVLMALCAALFIYAGGRLNGYYYMIFAAFVPMGCIALAKWWEKAAAKRWKSFGAALLIIVLVIAACGMTAFNRNIPAIGYDEEETPQYKFAQIISETEGANLLNVGFLDGGFYLASGTQPAHPWFCTLLANKEGCFEAQSAVVAAGGADYVVTMKKTLTDSGMDDSLYDLVAQETEPISYNEKGNTYYLYRLKELAPAE